MPQPDWIRCLAYEPKRKLLAWAQYDGKVIVWDTEKRAKVYSLPGRKYVVSSIAFSPDGSDVASAGAPNPTTPTDDDYAGRSADRRIFQGGGGDSALERCDRGGALRIASSRRFCGDVFMMARLLPPAVTILR